MIEMEGVHATGFFGSDFQRWSRSRRIEIR